MLGFIVVVTGAALVMAKLAIIGWLAHVALLKHAPGLAAWIPRDGGALLGWLFGAGIVAHWALVG